ncbi:exonuclease SbcCD subunit D [Sporosalibacterium faouarense]|uniref:exonuclease SbcCD subunit D n=1 Tax=Sporosalibacterium faouarense TaxID=516123 RepID=UPI00192BC669|nr:exonuclease SbcCD subunit D [Sporosalibacterium faouarense]
MRILHTSDWHLGKHLENHSRIEEQEKFIDDLIEIVEENNVDMILIAGDIYDTSNPPARAEKLFYNSLKRLSNGGERVIVAIAGNHDNPDRIIASKPLAYEHGVILLGKPNSSIELGRVGKHEILDAGQGYFELQYKDDRVVFVTLPYPSEQRLNEVFKEAKDIEEMRRSYSQRVGHIFSELSDKFRDEAINIATSHIFVAGGETTDSERPIQIGGGLTVDANMLPEKAQYIALGHLHRPQVVKGIDNRAYYSGSPLQYSKSERSYSKCVYLVDIEPGKDAEVEEILLKNRKPIEVWKCNSIEEAINKCEESQEREVWAYLEIKTDRVLTQSEIKEIKKLKPDVLAINPIFEDIDNAGDNEVDEMKERNIMELFEEFYISERKARPTQEFMELFAKIVNEEGEEDEA